MGRDQAESLSSALQVALEPLLAEVETVTEPEMSLIFTTMRRPERRQSHIAPRSAF